jgi:hypothetical protein
VREALRAQSCPIYEYEIVAKEPMGLETEAEQHTVHAKKNTTTGWMPIEWYDSTVYNTNATTGQPSTGIVPDLLTYYSELLYAEKHR